LFILEGRNQKKTNAFYSQTFEILAIIPLLVIIFNIIDFIKRVNDTTNVEERLN